MSSAPEEEGLYLLKCLENDFEEETVKVYVREGIGLCCDMDGLGDGFLLNHVHDNLCDPSWRKIEEKQKPS